MNLLIEYFFRWAHVRWEDNVKRCFNNKVIFSYYFIRIERMYWITPIYTNECNMRQITNGWRHYFIRSDYNQCCVGLCFSRIYHQMFYFLVLPMDSFLSSVESNILYSWYCIQRINLYCVAKLINTDHNLIR